METGTISYHKAAGKFLKSYYENNTSATIFFIYRFIRHLAAEAKEISKAVSLEGMDHQDAIVATWFLYTGVDDLTHEETANRFSLLNEFFEEVAYPHEHRDTVEEAIRCVIEKKYAQTKTQEVVSDAAYSQFILPNFVENIILLKDEVNRLTGGHRPELFFLKYYQALFIKARYYTEYALQNYHITRERNFQLLEKRIARLEETDRQTEKHFIKLNGGTALSNKETEEVFKIAFRNYNHLIAVADSKAALLINVNSIIISIMLVFVVSKVERNTTLLPPTILLLSVSMITILLCILASRPRRNNFTKDTGIANSQKVFFGSFDLIDPQFRSKSWETYYEELNTLFTGNREYVYLEVYKESYNVRKVLSRKFDYLSYAYWVFIIGLLVSIVTFVVSVRLQFVA